MTTIAAILPYFGLVEDRMAFDGVQPHVIATDAGWSFNRIRFKDVFNARHVSTPYFSSSP
jgi:hypothetical protein